MPPAINYLYGGWRRNSMRISFSTLLGYLPGTVGTVLAAKGATAAATAVVLRRRRLGVLALVLTDGRDGPAGLAPAQRRERV